MTIFYVKSLSLATILLGCTSTLVQAQEINNYNDFKLYCSDIAHQYDVASPHCDRYKQYYQDEIQQELERKQNTELQNNKVNRRNTNKSKITGYAGASLGAFFPEEDLSDALGVGDLLDTGFGGSLFIGAKWNQYVATDLEFIYFGGGTIDDDIDYSVWGLGINPRFIIPLTQNINPVAFFISPGLGISSADLEDNAFNLEDGETRLTWQIKAGLSLPIQDKYGAFLQIRYASQFEGNTVEFLGTEAGFSINF